MIGARLAGCHDAFVRLIGAMTTIRLPPAPGPLQACGEPQGRRAVLALTLVIGNKNYSSWSFRPWIAMKVAGIAFDEVVISLDAPDF
jgi:hypothetical protein